MNLSPEAFELFNNKYIKFRGETRNKHIRGRLTMSKYDEELLDILELDGVLYKMNERGMDVYFKFTKEFVEHMLSVVCL